MNETMSLLLATTVLAISGLGLYMYKSEDDDQNGGDYYAEEDEVNSDDEIMKDDILDHDDDEDDIDYYAPKARSRAGKSKTKRNKKGGGTKRKY
ncbi:MAG: hypothetical protein MUP82_01990 [Candidatus Marinimicrobia bacterium]|nr:hypothetical protein [Candidatus Neomarinimicrobiota bacterium]